MTQRKRLLVGFCGAAGVFLLLCFPRLAFIPREAAECDCCEQLQLAAEVQSERVQKPWALRRSHSSVLQGGLSSCVQAAVSLSAPENKDGIFFLFCFFSSSSRREFWVERCYRQKEVIDGSMTVHPRVVSAHNHNSWSGGSVWVCYVAALPTMVLKCLTLNKWTKKVKKNRIELRYYLFTYQNLSKCNKSVGNLGFFLY